MNPSAPVPTDPIVELFGFPREANSDAAIYHRQNHLCPFNNISARCTKDKSDDPLGVCSIRVPGQSLPIITCPVRFREEWRFTYDAAKFFFPEGANWKTLSEVRLKTSDGKTIGNIDHVLVQYGDDGKVIDFGTIEVQAVYVTGNIREPFRVAMGGSPKNYEESLQNGEFRVRADNLSSRKRLIPQLASKGSVLSSWGKRQAIVVDEPFFASFPEITEIGSTGGTPNLLWLSYGLIQEENVGPYKLSLKRRVETDFVATLEALSRSDFTPEPMNQFVEETLQEQLDRKLRTTGDAGKEDG